VPDAAVARIVYVVEADASVRQGLVRLVDSSGLEPRPFECVEAFLGQAPAPRAACALLDVSSAALRDPALRSRLRARAATLSVIALSADDDGVTRRIAREVGAQAFFRKPVDAAALLDAIDWFTRSETPGGTP